MRKVAVLSIDVEEWYQLEYFQKSLCNESQEILEIGTKNFLNLIEKEDVKATFFIVGDRITSALELLKEIKLKGNELSAHSFGHIRPLSQSTEEFQKDALEVKNKLQEHLELNDIGYRAPCFSIDKERYSKLQELGYKYDSSKINAGLHPLYGELDMEQHMTSWNNVYEENGFYEFELPTVKLFNKNIPISGGGWLRILPWPIFKILFKKFIKNSNTFFFFIHPFELTQKHISLPKDVNLLTRLRFSIGRKKALSRTQKLIKLLKKNNFEFHTFSTFINKMEDELKH
jgi:polysaccharide deacetylase family protein (PEP-CTERM system associated)